MAGEGKVDATQSIFNSPQQMGALLDLLMGKQGTATATTTETVVNNPGSTATDVSSGGTSGETVTINPGDISYLQQLYSELQGANYNGILEQIFQQAAGSIPGFQAAFQNSVGARSGGNSAVNAMLQRLLQQTTTSAQSQLVEQLLKNQTIRQNIGQGIAQATRGTVQTRRGYQSPQTITRTQAPSQSRQVQQAIPQQQRQDNRMKEMLVLAGLAKGGEFLKGMFGEKKGASGAGQADAAESGEAPAMSTTPVNVSSVPMTSAAAPVWAGPDFQNIYAQQQMPFFDNNQSFDFNSPVFDLPSYDAGAGYDFGDVFGNAFLDTWQPAATQDQVDNFDWGSWLDDQDQALFDAGWGEQGYTDALPVFDEAALSDWDEGSWDWW